MKKRLSKLLKKIVFSILLLYGYNLIVLPLGLLVPINLLTVSVLTLIGPHTLFSFILILIVVF